MAKSTSNGGLGGSWQEMELLVVVKAYPSVSTKYGEAVCVAGVRLDTPTPQWARLFPVRFRDLPPERQFSKYDVIRLRAQQHSTDRRAESYRPDLDSIRVGQQLKASGPWSARRTWVEPLLGASMCELYRGRRGGGAGPSLGVIRPHRVLDLVVRKREPWSPAQVNMLQQGSLLSTKTMLELPAYAFAYRYDCEAPGCRGHEQSIADWEIGQAVRAWERQGRNVVEAIREKWLAFMCDESRETMFFVGDQHLHPGAFMVLGTFYPEHRPVEAQLSFNLAA